MYRPNPEVADEDSIVAPYNLFACAVITHAVESWWRVTGVKPFNKSGGDTLNKATIIQGADEYDFDDPLDELRTFFESDWFEDLAFIAGLDWRRARSVLYNKSPLVSGDNGSQPSSSHPNLPE